ncbi:MAG: hypothetical protein FWC12_10685 [Treponema sp.]|nr:hypothetical protein [Treponema sp.]
MKEKYLSLKAFIPALIDAVMYADDKMKSSQNIEENILTTINPLRVAGIRVFFKANIFNKNDDLFLDFKKPDCNFNGEIILKPNNIEMVFEKNEK